MTTDWIEIFLRGCIYASCLGLGATCGLCYWLSRKPIEEN